MHLSTSHYSSPLLLRCLPSALLVTGLTLMARAGDPPSATYPLEFRFGQGSNLDVAPYAPGGHATYLFCVKAKTRELQRYAGTGSSNWLQVSASMPPPNSFPGFFGTGPIGLAAIDRPGAIGANMVLATEALAPVGGGPPIGGVLWRFDTDLVLIGAVVLADPSWNLLRGPHGIAMDEGSDAYVIDRVTRKVYRYAASEVLGISPVAIATHEYGDGLQSPYGVSVDHNGRVHVTYVNGDYIVYETTGAIAASSNSGSQSNLRGVCALHPCADGFTTRYQSSPGNYVFERTDWNWSTPTFGVVDLTVTYAVPARPGNVEFQKSSFAIGGQPFGWQVQRSNERLYVAGPTGMAAFGQSYDSVAVPLSRRAWYRFEEAHDMAWNFAYPIEDYLGSNVAIAGPNAPRNVEGMVGCGMDTRGGSAYAEAPDSPQLDFGTGSIAIEGWLRSEQRTGVVTVLDKRDGTGAGYSVYMHMGRLGFQTNIGTTHQNFTSAPVIADGRWRHFAIVLDRDLANTLTIFIDGLPAGTTNALAGNVDNSSPLCIGRINPGANGVPFVGGLDELTLYAQPLSAAQVAGIAAARSAGKHLWASPPF